MTPAPLPTPVRARALARLGSGEGPLAVGGLDARDLAARFGTPLFVYDAAVLRARAAAVRDAFGPRVEVLFALKANPNVAVARVLGDVVAGAEVASAGEILVARAAGFAGERIQFAGPGKSETDLATALEANVGTINLEAPAEHEALARLARSRGVRPGVAIRVNPAREARGARIKMGGGSKKFGVDAEDVPAFARRIEQDGACELRGLHVYTGSQAFDAAAWLATAADLVQLGLEVEHALGRPLASLDFGGGFGIAVHDADPTFDLAAAGQGLGELLRGRGAPTRAFLELGRYLCAEAGVYLTSVLHTKRSGGRAFAQVDGGMHHFGAAAGLGSVIRRPYPVVRCADPAARGAPWTVCGPLCTPADDFGVEHALPDVRAGDLLAVLLAGAYGLTFSPVLFLGHPMPAEVLVDGAEAMLVRRRGRPEDALGGQVF